MFNGAGIVMEAVESWWSDGRAGGNEGCMNTTEITGTENDEQRNLDTFSFVLHYVDKHLKKRKIR